MCFKVFKLSCVMVLLFMVNSIMSKTHKSHRENVLKSHKEQEKNNFGNFGTCVLEGNYTCIELLFKSKLSSFLRSKEIQLSENVSIEKMNNNSNEEEETINEIIESKNPKKLSWTAKVDRIFANRSLKFDILDLFRLRLSKSSDSEGDVDMRFELISDSKENEMKGIKGHRTMKIVAPLIIGFIVTGMGILSIAFVKALLMKAFFVSKLAALAAVFVVIKKVIDSRMATPKTYEFAQYPIPYDSGYGSGSYGYATPYNAYTHYATIIPTEHPWATQYASHGFEASEHDSGAAAEALESSDDDLQGHYSNHHVTTANATSKMRRKSISADGYRGVIKLVKSQANRLPVLAYRHTGTGRKLNTRK